MKFLNKKEQVMDLKLTSYGHYLLSIGKFKPEYYAFYDDNVLYDGAYAGITESSNRIHDRIKKDTQYLEGQTLFQEIEVPSEIIDEGSMMYYESDITPIMKEPRNDIFRFDQMIGDAFLLGDTDLAPSWKVVSLDGKILSSKIRDDTNALNIPQLNITLRYRKQVKKQEFIGKTNIQNARTAVSTTQPFSDGYVVELVPDDILLYIEETNTMSLKDNFDIEVYQVHTGSLAARCPTCKKQDKFEKKYFQNNYERLLGAPIDDNYIANMKKSRRQIKFEASQLSSSILYYFDVKTDREINSQLACRGAEYFNKNTLYVDLDHDCRQRSQTTETITDIYGPVTEPEICQ